MAKYRFFPKKFPCYMPLGPEGFGLCKKLTKNFSCLCNFKTRDDLREKESLVTLTHNVLLANLCCANLLSAVLVKANCAPLRIKPNISLFPARLDLHESGTIG